MANLGWWQTWAIILLVTFQPAIHSSPFEFWIRFALGIIGWVALWFAIESYGKKRFATRGESDD